MATTYSINVVVDPSGAIRGNRAVRKQFKQTQDGADRLRNSIKRAFAFAGGITLLTKSVRLLADFSQAMSTVKAITKATGQEFQSFREEALRLGASTRFTATEAANAMVFLARTGFSTTEVLRTTGDTLLLAQAGALGLAEAADISSNVLKGFRLNVNELTRVVDVMAKTSISANTNIQEMGFAMKLIAPVSAGLNVSLEETSAAIGVLSDAGLKGTLAGTGLRRILADLEAPTKAGEKILKSFGITTDEVNVSQVGLIGALKRLKQAGVGAGDGLRLFGLRGGPAFEILSNAIPQIEALNLKLNESKGTAKEVAEEMDKNLNGALLALKSAIENVVLQFGELGAQSGLTSFVRGMTDALRGLANNLDTVIRLATAAGIALAVNFAKKGVLPATKAMKVFTLAIVANPMTAIVTGLTVGISLLIAFSDQLTISEGSLTTLADVAAASMDFIRRSFDGLQELFSGVFETIKSLSGEAFTAMGINGQTGFNLLSASAIESFKDIEFSVLGILKAGALVGDRFIGIFIGVVKFIENLFKNMGRAIIEIFIDLLNFIDKKVVGALNATLEGVNPILNLAGIADIAPAELSQLVNTYSGAGEILGDSLADGILAGADFNLLRGALDSVVESAEAKALARSPQEKVKPKVDTDKPDPRDKIDETNKGGIVEQTGFQKIRKELQRDLVIEQELLGKTSAQREIANGLLQVEADLKRSLSDISVGGQASEREQVSNLLESTQALQNQAEIYDFLKAPQQEYMETLGAINQLLKDNKISQIEANVALQGTQLAGDLNNLQGELNPEEAETTRLAEQLMERQLIVEQAMEARIITATEGTALLMEIEQKHHESILSNEQDRAAMQLGAAANTFDTLASMTKGYAGEQSAAYKVLFGISKAFAIAEASVKISQGIAQAYSLGFPAGLVAAASVVSQTAGLVQQISGTQFEGGFQSGGSFDVGGSGGPDTQHVSFMATPGERVSIDTPQQQRTKSNTSQDEGTENNGVRIMNVIDPNMVEDYLSSPGGEKTYINFIQRNAASVNSALA